MTVAGKTHLPIPDAMLAAERDLLAPGGMFEMETAAVLGEPVRLYKNRARSLRDFVVNSKHFLDAEYLVFSDGVTERRMTFAQHRQHVASVAAALQEKYGVGKGDRVAILAANCPEWIITFWATVSLGAVAVGLNGWWTGPEIRYGLDDSQPKVLIADAKRIARLEGAATGVPTVIIESEFSELLSYRPDAALPDGPIAEDDPAVILYTSGTTGRPKGAVNTHRNIAALVGCNFFQGMRMAKVFPPMPQADGKPPAPNCVFVTSPLFHVSGLHNAAVTALAGGTKSVWMAGRFDAGAALRLIEKEKVTAWGYTATLLHRLLSHPDRDKHDLSSIRALGGGGSHISSTLQAGAREAMAGIRSSLTVGYGLTECSSLATLNAGAELAAHPDSVGRPLPVVDLQIRDDHGNVLPDGAEGEVHVHGPLVMLEYWNKPAETATQLRPGRWLRTGDIGRLEGRRLFLASRKRDLIIRGGENIYPVEIEHRLEAHPHIAEAAVLGIDHPEFGQEVKAVVVPRLGATVDVKILAEWVADALAYFKVPQHWEVRGEPLPRNATGKVLKHALSADAKKEFVEE